MKKLGKKGLEDIVKQKPNMMLNQPSTDLDMLRRKKSSPEPADYH